MAYRTYSLIHNGSSYALITILSIFSSGCITSFEQQQVPLDNTQTAHTHTVIVPAPAHDAADKIDFLYLEAKNNSLQRNYDWNRTVQFMVSKMLQVVRFNPGGVLLVDHINNSTNGNLNSGEGTETLRNALAQNDKLTLVSAQQLSIAKQQLGLSPQDSLNSRSKAIGIARNVGAQYMLYSNATGNVNAPSLQMQLMLVQTGEIIWSGKSAIYNI